MRVVICDRCRKVIADLYDDMPSKEWLTFSTGGGAEYDLCEECGQELMEFMQEKGVRE